MTRPVSLRKEGLPGIARVRRTLNVPWNCALAGPGVSRSARAIARFGGARDPGPSGLLSSITYKRFKRSECQLVNIIIMTSNMARSLHRVTRPARETGIRLTRGRITVVRRDTGRRAWPRSYAGPIDARPALCGLECFVRSICSVWRN